MNVTLSDVVTAPVRGVAAGHDVFGSVRRHARTVIIRAALPTALLLWLLSLRQVNLQNMGDLGLLGVLPALFWVSLAVLTTGFLAAIHGKKIGNAWPAAYVVGLIAIIHATPSLLYPTLRYAWAWKHVDVVDAMLRNGGKVPHPGWLDIYNQWPGFFVMQGLVLRFTGLQSAMGYAQWATPFANLLLLGPLLLMYRTFTHNLRLIWGAAWIFYSCSWIGQDYFSPQTFGFLLFITVIGMVLRTLPSPSPAARARRSRRAGSRWHSSRPAGLTPEHPAPDAPPVRETPSYGRPGLRFPGGAWRWNRFVMVVLIEAVLVTSHQLTPLMLIATLIALSIPRRNRRTTLPVLVSAAALEVAWFATVARPYISANLRVFVQTIAAPDSNAPTWLTGLGTPARGQILVSWVDRGLSFTVITLALIALIRCPWTRHTALPLLLLAPLPMPALNSYGGEMIFRAYLFALPAASMLIAALVLTAAPLVKLRALTSFVLLPALLGGLFFGYYGKEDVEYFTPKEAAATAYLDGVAPAGSLIVSVTNNIPNIDYDYDVHNRVVIAWNAQSNRLLLLANPLAGLEQAMMLAAPPGPVYVILNRGQAAECYITGLFPANTVPRLEAAVDRSPVFKAVYRNSDAVVYQLVDRSILSPEPPSKGAP